MSLPASTPPPVNGCFPRVSGDEPQIIGESIQLGTFSPRERG